MLRLFGHRFAAAYPALFLLLAGCDAEKASAPALATLTPLECGKPISFGSAGDGERLKLTGWAPAEPSFTWTDGIAASLALRLPTTRDAVQLQFRMCGMNVPSRVPFQRLDVYVNSEKLVRWQVVDDAVFTLLIPQKFTSKPDPLLIVDFLIPTAQSPAALGIGGDSRRLGIRLAELTPLVVPKCEYGKPVAFRLGGDGERLVRNGWAPPEPYFRWTDGALATLVFEVPPTTDPVQIHFRMCGMNVPGLLPFQPVDLYINGEKLQSWEIAEERDFVLDLPARFLAADVPMLTVDFHIPKATSPASLGQGGDQRRLGIRLSEMTISRRH